MNIHVPFKYNTCPLCTEKNIANGMGPSNNKFLKKMLDLLPSSRKLKKAARIHDCLYHLGIFEKDRKIADERFLFEMKKIIRSDVKGWFNQKWYISHAYRNYWAVRWGGKSSFNYGGCCSKLAQNKTT